MDYEILIGEVIELSDQTVKPKQVLIITADQFAMIEMFADIRRDEMLNPIYIINKCEFKVAPHFKQPEKS